MQILHYALFYSSSWVRNYLYSREIDPNTVHLNDYKFMERAFFICNNLLGIKPRVTIQQFFKYGFSEQKMMMCVDTILAVKHLTKELKIQSSLKSTRKATARSSSSNRRSPMKNLTQTALTIKHRSLAEIQEDMRQDFLTWQQKEAAKHLNKKRKRTKQESLECQMRLTGNKEFQSLNRHRHPQMTCYMEQTLPNLNEVQDIQVDKQISGTPVRYRAIHTAIEQSEKVTHKLDFEQAMPEFSRPDIGYIDQANGVQPLVLNERTHYVPVEDYSDAKVAEQRMSQKFNEFKDTFKSGEYNLANLNLNERSDEHENRLS